MTAANLVFPPPSTFACSTEHQHIRPKAKAFPRKHESRLALVGVGHDAVANQATLEVRLPCKTDFWRTTQFRLWRPSAWTSNQGKCHG
jgi:hypothetical protein